MSGGTNHPEANRDPAQDRAVRRVRQLARLLDGEFSLPGTNYRFGWDALIGLIPGADIFTAIPALYILFEARRLKMSKRILLSMAANIIVDTLIGLIPVLGDLFDFAFKSNARNARLFEKGLRKVNREGAIDI